MKRPVVKKGIAFGKADEFHLEQYKLSDMISGRVHFSVIQRAADGMVLGHHKVTFKRGKGDTLESEGHEGAAAALAKHLNLEPGKRAGVWLKPEGWQMPEYR